MRRRRIFTWHLHRSYLFYLAHAPHEFYVPVKSGRPEGYVGLPEGGRPWPANLTEVPADEVARLELDCVLTQTRKNYLEDRHDSLSQAQLHLPHIHLEHDPPREHPVDQRHPVDDPSTLLVHVTPFNALMWDSGRTPTCVVEHGVTVPRDVRYEGDLERGLTLVNNLPLRGRRVGADVFARVRADVPIDLVGMGSEETPGGVGEVPHHELPAFEVRYRFLFNPIRYTSLGLAVCEAMMLGMPIIGLATTEYATVIENGVSGYVDTRVERLVERMRELLADRGEARRLGDGARRSAEERFSIDRFVSDWNDAFALVTA